MNRILQFVILAFAAVVAHATTASDTRQPPPSKPKIAIIIDDLGYQVDSVYSLTNLQQAITFAVIPFTPFAEWTIETAQAAQREVILHVPMETINQQRWERGLTSEMNYDQFRQQLDHMLERYPQAIGVNNHGGSKLTADEERMRWVMESLASRNLYFLDSRTTSESRAIEAALDANLAYVTRDVFLDHVKTPDAIIGQIQQLKKIAQKRGYAVAIGHPYPETIAALQEHLPILEQEGFEFTFCSELVKTPESRLASHTESLEMR